MPLTDHQGSVRDVVTYDVIVGTTVENHIVYDAYGQITAESDPSVQFFVGFTGREVDPESDLTYYRARYYDAGLGIWTSEDPIGFAAGDGNLYRYVGNTPGQVTDPSGLEPPPGSAAAIRQELYNLPENKKLFEDTQKKLNKGKKIAEEFQDLALDNMPGVGQVKNGAEALTGNRALGGARLFEGEEIPMSERGTKGVFSLAGLLGVFGWWCDDAAEVVDDAKGIRPRGGAVSDGIARTRSLTDQYADAVNSNRPWSWAENIEDGASLTAGQRRAIKQEAIQRGLIANVPMKPGTRYPDFQAAGLIKRVDSLPEHLWKSGDKAQFDWLDARIPGGRPAGMWSHAPR